MNRIVKRVSTAVATLILSAVYVTPTSAARPASSITLDCVGPAQSVYTPGLLSSSQSVAWQENNYYSICESSDSAIISGTASASGVAELSCFVDSVVSYENPDYIITWSNGEISNFASTVTIRQLDGSILGNAEGRITKGKFAGATASSWWFYPLTDPSQCERSPGVMSQTGVNTLRLRRP
jgi:hypothetical protein